MLTRLNGGCRIGIVLWVLALRRIHQQYRWRANFCLAVSGLTVIEKRRLIARFVAAPVCGLLALFARISSRKASDRAKAPAVQVENRVIGVLVTGWRNR